MNKFFVSVGLVAAGTAGLHAAYAPNLTPMESTKIWSVDGTLRGFYDNNYTTASTAKGSWGFEVSPSVQLNVPLQQTEFGLSYTYGMYYYFERESLHQNPIDQTHEVDLWVDHAFTERWQGTVQDTFVVGQEPGLIDPNTSVQNRVEGNNISNQGSLTLNTVWTRLFSTSVNYQNSFYDYQNSGTTQGNASFGPTPPFGGGQDASLAGLLNRIGQNLSLDLQWHVAPETVVLLGGMVGLVNYTGDEPIAYNATTGDWYNSDTRDGISYFAYVGLVRSLLPNLSFSGKVGAQYTDSYNDPAHTTSLSPYGDLSLTWTYLPGSYAQVGFTESQNATDQAGYDGSNGQIAIYTQSSTAYASINHKLTSKLTGSLIGRWQNSIYHQGLYNNDSDNYYTLGVNFSYYFTPHFSADAGYNLDYLSSQIPGNDYTRNRYYWGVSAAF